MSNQNGLNFNSRTVGKIIGACLFLGDVETLTPAGVDTSCLVRTGVDVELLKKIGMSLSSVPESFKLHGGLKRILKKKVGRKFDGFGRV